MEQAANSYTGFSSKWLARNAGYDYRKDRISDPLKRIEMIKARDRVLNELYPEVYYKIPSRTLVNLGEFGISTMPRLFGCELKYEKELKPVAFPIIPEKIKPLDLKAPSVDDGLLWLAEEYDKIKELYGQKVRIVKPDLQGPMNIAFKLCGEHFFHYVLKKSKKHIGHHIMQVVTDTYIEVHKWMRKLLNQKLNSSFIVSECTSYFIGPKTFEEFNLKYDTQAVEELGPIFVHSCGPNSHEKLDLFFKMPKFTGADLSYGTDLKYAREIFYRDKFTPLLIVARIQPKDILLNSTNQITEKVNKLLEDGKGGPLTMMILDVPFGTPKQNVLAFHQTVSKFNQRFVN